MVELENVQQLLGWTCEATSFKSWVHSFVDCGCETTCLALLSLQGSYKCSLSSDWLTYGSLPGKALTAAQKENSDKSNLNYRDFILNFVQASTGAAISTQYHDKTCNWHHVHFPLCLLKTHAEVSVSCCRNRGRYFTSSQHENNYGNVFKQTLIIYLHLYTY